MNSIPRPPALVLLALLAAGCGGGASPSPSPAAQVPSHPDQLQYPSLRFDVPDAAKFRTALSSGAVAYLIEDPSLPIAEFQVYIRGGSFQEPRGKEGVADLMASLMRTGGTSTREPNALDEELDFLAAQLGVSVGDVQGSATLSLLSKDLDKGLSILVDVLRNPAFRQEKLDTLKAQVMDQLKARNDSTGAIEARELNLLMYGDYPLNRLATRASIASITREDLIAFHAGWVHPRNFIVAGAGAFKREELARKMDEAFKAWPPSEAKPAPAPKVTHAAKPGIYAFHKEGKNINQGRVTMAHMGVDIHHPDVQALRVMSYILGAGGFSSRLMQKVRTEEGLAYDVRSDLRPGFAYPWPFKISFQSKSESCAYAAKLCLAEIARLRGEGVSPEELQAARQFFVDAFPALFFATKLQTASTFAQAEVLGYPKDYYATYREKIARLTPADIRRVAQEHLHPERFAWVVVGNIPAIKKGDGTHPAVLSDFGPVTDVPLPDPFTLERQR